MAGGFGSSGVEGKISSINYVRTQRFSYLGLCYGLHLAVVEFARNVCGLQDAHTTEVEQNTPYPVIIFTGKKNCLIIINMAVPCGWAYTKQQSKKELRCTKYIPKLGIMTMLVNQ